ncbi:hypothetical protein N7507_008297 [Penicillium longicatenatum]|nr:hypothetical protein N7507_008297 [Penicillium longicatenatum]
MATSITNGRPAAVRIAAVLAGSWLTFRAQSPNKSDTLLSEHDKKTMVGGQTGENKVGRAPLTKTNDKP